MTRRWILTGVVLASLGAGCQLEHNLTPPADAHVDAGPRIPPIEGLGEPGWREGTEPWYPGTYFRAEGFSIWSHAGGVYMALHRETVLEDESIDYQSTIWFNSGAGWDVYLDGRTGANPWLGEARRIQGSPSGELLGGGSRERSSNALLRLPPTGPVEAARVTTFDLFVVNESLAYALGSEQVYRFDGETWTAVPSPLPFPATRIWADADVLYAVGPEGTLLRLQGVDWTVIDTGTLEEFISVWGFSPTDLWLGGVNRELWHYDGTTLTEVTWPNQDPDDTHVNALWGASGVLYAVTDRVVVRGEAGTFEVIANWSCEWPCGVQITDVWGNGPDEVFFALYEHPHPDHPTPYNPAFLLRWDGTEFHWF